MPTEHITIKDLAKAAGVSIGTVDRVLHNRGEVAAKTRQKIMQLAEKLNYKPNLLARALTSRKTLRITAFLPSANDGNSYWACHRIGINAQAEKLAQYQFAIETIDFELFDAADFCAKAQKICDSKPDGVVFAPIFKKESILFAQQLDNQHIPYAFIDTFVEGTNSIGFVGEDAFQSGRVAANIIDYGTAPDKDILMVNLAKDIDNTQHLITRNQGFMSYFMDKGKNNGLKINIEIPSSAESTVKERLDSVFLSNRNIGAIWVSGAKSYVVARYLDSVGRSDINLVGYDVYNENVEYLKRGVISCLIAQQPTEQAEKVIGLMFDYLSKNTKAQSLVYQKVEIVNSENVKFYTE